MDRRTDSIDAGGSQPVIPPLAARVTIIHFAIGCCALTMAVVIAVAVAAAG